MGVNVERVERPFRASTREVTDFAELPSGTVTAGTFGWAFGPTENAAHHAANRLLASGHRVMLADASFRSSGVDHPAGTFVVASGDGTAEAIRGISGDLGLTFTGLANEPAAPVSEMHQPRVGLYKAWHSRVDDQGWTLWLLEQYDFAVDTLHDADIRHGDLSAYDAIVLPNHPGQEILRGNAPGTMPAEFVGGIGAEGTAQMKRFVEGGGTLIAFDGATDLPMDHFGIPVRNAVADLSPQDFFVPGSLIRTDVDVGHPLAAGMQSTVAGAFSQSRAFDIVRLPRAGEGGTEDTPLAAEPAVDIVARYAQDNLLLSGWAMGEERYLAGRPAMVNVRMGTGNVVLFGFRPQFRGQPSGTFKLFFNAIQRAAVGPRPIM
jgi:hypothetical protein